MIERIRLGARRSTPACRDLRACSATVCGWRARRRERDDRRKSCGVTRADCAARRQAPRAVVVPEPVAITRHTSRRMHERRWPRVGGAHAKIGMRIEHGNSGARFRGIRGRDDAVRELRAVRIRVSVRIVVHVGNSAPPCSPFQHLDVRLCGDRSNASASIGRGTIHRLPPVQKLSPPRGVPGTSCKRSWKGANGDGIPERAARQRARRLRSGFGLALSILHWSDPITTSRRQPSGQRIVCVEPHRSATHTTSATASAARPYQIGVLAAGRPSNPQPANGLVESMRALSGDRAFVPPHRSIREPKPPPRPAPPIRSRPSPTLAPAAAEHRIESRHGPATSVQSMASSLKIRAEGIGRSALSRPPNHGTHARTLEQHDRPSMPGKAENGRLADVGDADAPLEASTPSRSMPAISGRAPGPSFHGIEGSRREKGGELGARGARDQTRRCRGKPADANARSAAFRALTTFSHPDTQLH